MKLQGNTIGLLYGPAMVIETQAEADEYFELLVKRCIEEGGVSRETAKRIQRSNLGYFAGYYDNETRERVERLFKCSHPIFGSIADKGAPTPEQALEMGKQAGEKAKAEQAQSEVQSTKMMKLTDILTSEQLDVVESILNETPDQMDATRKLRKYLNQFKVELEAKGVVADYLAYVIAYRQWTGGDNGDRVVAFST